MHPQKYVLQSWSTQQVEGYSAFQVHNTSPDKIKSIYSLFIGDFLVNTEIGLILGLLCAFAMCFNFSAQVTSRGNAFVPR